MPITSFNYRFFFNVGIRSAPVKLASRCFSIHVWQKRWGKIHFLLICHFIWKTFFHNLENRYS